MPIAISEDHKLLHETAVEMLTKREARAAARALLEADAETLPEFWDEVVNLGWLGLHIPEDLGGSGYGLEETAVVVEAFGSAVAPGPFVPTVAASAGLAATGDAAAADTLRGMADGSTLGAVSLGGNVTISGGTASGDAGAVVGAGLADVIVVTAGDDAAIVTVGDGVTVDVPKNMDPTRRSGKVTLTDAPAIVIAGGARAVIDCARIVFSAEAVGLASEATKMAAEYAKERVQFGRVIAMYQGVKHHCANMAVAAELATSATWDAARAAASGGDQRHYAAAVAASLAAPAADFCANLSTQVHGGIAITWEHDAHLFMRRATTLLNIINPYEARAETTELVRKGVKRDKSIELPPEAEAIRTEVRALVESLQGLSDDEQKAKLTETGYAMPHWPEPYGRAAGAVEQLVIEEEFKAGDITKPSYGITAWNILTIIQYGNQDQIDRWVAPALRQETVWCQLFSEPEAGSDAAGVKTKATRVDGGWLVNGQKVWTSGAHYSDWGFATVRTNPDVPKHDGITMMAIDMHGEGVEVRPLKMTNGGAEFNEVFFTDVFVPDDDVVGPVDGGWTVARATLGNESVSIGGSSGYATPASALVMALDAAPEGRLPGGQERIGEYCATFQAFNNLNLRSAHRAVAGGEPGPEGAMTKLIVSELGHEAAEVLTVLGGQDSVFMENGGAMTNQLVLMHRGMSIAGGTSEIKRNQIGERILGLPRDPLIK